MLAKLTSNETVISNPCGPKTWKIEAKAQPANTNPSPIPSCRDASIFPVNMMNLSA